MLEVNEVAPERLERDANLFQSAFWAHFKKTRGYETQTFSIAYQGTRVPLIVIHRPCTGDSVFGYIPHGPDISVDPDRQGRVLESISEQVRPRLPPHCCFLRYDLPWQNPYAVEAGGPSDWSGPPEPRIRELRMNFGSRKWNLRKAPTDIQPPDTVVLDLEQSAARLLRGMHQKTRYCVRSAFRRGVRVEERGMEALPLWHRVHRETAARQGIAAEGLDYFRDLFATNRGHRPGLRLYLAFRADELLAASVIALDGSTAVYLYSGSSLAGRKHMASYALLWRAIMEAKKEGCRWFDLFGIPPTGRSGHPMHGLYRFKTRFGGHVLHLRGCWDYPFRVDRYPALAFASGNRSPFHQ